MTKTSSGTALVIGGGVVGRACALALLCDGWRVTLLDADARRQAPSWGNAGHIATEQVSPLASTATLRSAAGLWHRFGGPLHVRQPWRHLPWMTRFLCASRPKRFRAGQAALGELLAGAMPAWQRLVKSLDAPRQLQEGGHWLCWESASSARRGLSKWNAAPTGTAGFSAFGPELHARLQSQLKAPIAAGIAFSGTAQIADLAALPAQFEHAFARSGGVQRATRVKTLRAQGRHVQAIDEHGQAHDADLLMVCAGVHSRGLMAGVGHEAPLIAERGYHLQWTAHAWPTLPPVVFEDRSMILTRFAGGLRAAGFTEFTDPDSAPDPCKWQRLRRHVQALGIPVFGEPVAWSGARPTLPDYLPALGRSPRFDNLAYAFGHQHLGLTLAAATAELMADLCAGRTSGMDLAPFDLERFADAPKRKR